MTGRISVFGTVVASKIFLEETTPFSRTKLIGSSSTSKSSSSSWSLKGSGAGTLSSIDAGFVELVAMSAGLDRLLIRGRYGPGECIYYLLKWVTDLTGTILFRLDIVVVEWRDRFAIPATAAAPAGSVLVGEAAAKLSMGVRARTYSTATCYSLLKLFAMMQAEVVL